MSRLLLTFFLVTVLSFVPHAGDAQSVSRKYEELPLGDVRAEGWLKEMLVRQRDGDVVVLDFPMKTTVSRWYENAASVERGPLSYALKIESKWVEKFFTEDVGYGKTYWEVYPESPWNYALIKSDVNAPEKTFKVNTDSLRLSSDWYLSPDNAPVYIEARAARLPHWTLYNGSAGPFPYSQIPGKCASGNSAYRSSGEYERIILIPYGCTDLRISEFPVINH